METSLSAFVDFPDDFQKNAVCRILETVNQGECLQLVGLPGSGKSILFHALLSSQNILKYHLKNQVSKLKIIYFDFNLIPEKTTISLLKFILQQLGEKTETNDLNLLLKTLEASVNNLFSPPVEKIVFIFDDFDNLVDPNLADFYKILKGIYSPHRFKLIYLFGVNQEIRQPDKLSFFDKMATLLAENLLYLPCLSEKDSLWFITQKEKQLGRKISEKDRKEILALSGGFMRTIKCLVQSVCRGADLKQLCQNPTLDIHLNYHFENLWENLSFCHLAIEKLIVSQKIEEPDRQTLLNLNIINDKDEFLSPIFRTFLRKKLTAENAIRESIGEKVHLSCRLTANEHKLLKLLTEKTNQICSREEIAEAVWGEKVSLEITNHALDQLVHRLKNKLLFSQPPVKIQTLRGRGHQLTIS